MIRKKSSLFTIAIIPKIQNQLEVTMCGEFMKILISDCGSHAMPEGGDITITTRNTVLNKEYCEISTFELEPKEYIEIELRDSGCGIPLDHLEKIFEPFFTTKEHGKGTGLGLAAVYGTIVEHHGAITVYSEVGVGTVFHIYIPSTEELVQHSKQQSNIISGTGLFLLVDDEEIIRITGKLMLEELGYTVILAKDGEEAIEIFKERFREIDLVIMDMIMPKMSGKEAFYKMREIDKNCGIIISSGFTKDELLSELRNAGLLGFINKPFRDFELCKLLSEIKK